MGDGVIAIGLLAIGLLAIGLAVGVIVAASCSFSPFVHASVSVEPLVHQLADPGVGAAGLLYRRQDTCLGHVALTVLLQ